MLQTWSQPRPKVFSSASRMTLVLVPSNQRRCKDAGVCLWSFQPGLSRGARVVPDRPSLKWQVLRCIKSDSRNDPFVSSLTIGFDPVHLLSSSNPMLSRRPLSHCFRTLNAANSFMVHPCFLERASREDVSDVSQPKSAPRQSHSSPGTACESE